MIGCANDGQPLSTGDVHLEVVVEAHGMFLGAALPLPERRMGCMVIRAEDGAEATHADIDRMVAGMLHRIADDLYPLDTKD